MMIGLPELVLAAHTAMFPAYHISSPSQNPHCNLGHIIAHTPKFSDEDFLGSIRVDISHEIEKVNTKHGTIYHLQFYKLNKTKPADYSMNPRDWVNLKEFDVFVVYEIGEDNSPGEHPIGFGYFWENAIMAAYLGGINEGNETQEALKAFCTPIARDAYAAVLNVLKALHISRISQSGGI